MQKTIVFTVINDLRSDQRMEKICTTLQLAGFQVCLLGRALPDSPELQTKPYQQIRIKCIFQKGKLFYIEYNIRLFIWLSRHYFHVYSAVDLDTLWPCYMASKKWNSRLVYDAHEYFPEVPEVINRKWIHKIWTWWEKLWVPKVHQAYTVSGSLQKLFEEKYGVNFQLIRNVPYITECKREAETVTDISERYILYQGALNKGRGLEGLILAMHQIPCQLWIIGEGDLSESLRVLVDQEGLDYKVKFIGFISPDKLVEYTCKAYIGYNVSEPLGLSYYYSLNNKFFDYIMSGLPSLTNDFPEYRRHYEIYETGVLIATPKPEDIAFACNQLLENKTLYDKLQANCYEASRQWNWTYESEKLIQLYKNL